MKPRSTQFGARKNPDSARVHGLRLTVNPSSLATAKELKNLDDGGEAFSSPPREVKTFESPLTESVKESTTAHTRGEGHLLTVREVADLLQVTTSWVYEHTRPQCAYPLPSIKLGKYLRFHSADLANFLRSNSANS